MKVNLENIRDIIEESNLSEDLELDIYGYEDPSGGGCSFYITSCEPALKTIP